MHSAWWPHVISYGPAALREKQVICFADNPPAFYLTQPGFAAAARRVDLWIARTREALAQFQILGLPAVSAPYCVDDSLFHPTEGGFSPPPDLGSSGRRLCHRQLPPRFRSANLHRPKRQKGPDLLQEIARQLFPKLPRLVVLLAGPRRHYLKKQLEKDGIPFRIFSNVPVGESDDFEANILPRAKLERALSTPRCLRHLLPLGERTSLAARGSPGRRRPVISTPVGISRDLLARFLSFPHPGRGRPPCSADHAGTGSLTAPAQASQEKALVKTTPRPCAPNCWPPMRNYRLVVSLVSLRRVRPSARCKAASAHAKNFPSTLAPLSPNASCRI